MSVRGRFGRAARLRRRSYLENLCRLIVGVLETVSARSNPWLAPGQIRKKLVGTFDDRDVRLCLGWLLTARCVESGKDHKGQRVYRTLVSASPW